MAFTTYSDLASKQEIEKILIDEVSKVNLSVPKKQKIKKFVLLYKEFDADDNELTRTKKLRRNFVINKYGENAYTIAYRVNNKSIIQKIKDIETKNAQEYKDKAIGWEREAGRLKRKCDDQTSDIERFKKTIRQQDLTIDRLEGENMKLKKDNTKLKTSVSKLMKLTKK